MADIPRASTLYQKILGCLAGSALGDSIGGVTEMMSYQRIEELFGWVDRPMPTGDTQETARFDPGKPAGVYTDDTRLKHLLCQAIIEKGGRVTADDLAAVWLEHMEGWFYTPVVNAYYKVFAGDVRPRDAGRGCMASNSSAMSISPVGIINAGNPRQAAQDAYDVASLIHEGDARDGAVAVATAVSAAFTLDATAEGIIQEALPQLYSKGRMKARIEGALELAHATGEYRAFREAFCEQMLLPSPQKGLVSGRPTPEGFYDAAEPRETVPIVFGLLLIAEGDWRRSVEYAANFGRDCDTIASMLGAITGALQGAGAIPKDWIDLLNRVNPEDQYELADGLAQALQAERETAQGWLDTLRSMI